MSTAEQTAAAQRTTRKRQGIVGRFFHSYRGAELHWQGKVLGRPEPGVYLVQLFEWFTGGPSEQLLVPFTDMASWKFYDTADDWRYAYDQYDRRKSAAERMVPMK